VTTQPDNPTWRLPALAVDCPRCGAQAGHLCTSHDGARTRAHNVHQDRTKAYAAQEPTHGA
jgi:hypothetical protein